MKKIFTILGIVLFSVILSTKGAYAEETSTKASYYDNEDGRFVTNIDEYLEGLNLGLIQPFDSSVEERYPSQSREILEPTKKCSNIFGHKWSEWGVWRIVSTTHSNTGICVSVIERERYCQRRLCGAWQTERDLVYNTNCTH